MMFRKIGIFLSIVGLLGCNFGQISMINRNPSWIHYVAEHASPNELGMVSIYGGEIWEHGDDAHTMAINIDRDILLMIGEQTIPNYGILISSQYDLAPTIVYDEQNNYLGAYYEIIDIRFLFLLRKGSTESL